MPIFKIKHITNYRYETPVRDSANQIILFPVKDEFQKVIQHDLTITENPDIEIFIDYYGNEVGTFTQNKPHTQLKIFSKVTVETFPKPLPQDDIFSSEQWNTLCSLKYEIPYIDYLRQETFEGIDDLKKITEDIKTSSDTPFQVARKFCNHVFQNFEYIKGVTAVDTTINEILSIKAGVCQDFAHVLTAMLRLTGIPARYVSGYICPNKDGMRGEGATHAWAEIYLPEYGWIGLDPTNNCIANEKHVRLAVGRNFTDCSPVKGVYKGGTENTMEVSVSVGYNDDDSHENETYIKQKEINYTKLNATNTVEKNQNSYRQYMEAIQQQQ
ncbi:transglutaminase family protein [Pedobacter sp. MW01-1-1]|uniref:transglutaminase family protein n=1 Tax=Pedobacter sp. MW01-1-1 TaxID=3383027 RepID=UPI003FF015B6